MNRYTRFAALLAATAAVGAFTLPAHAQYATEFVPAKLAHQGTSSHAIAGSGTVVVQVQVNPDGTHKVTRVIKSTNPGDNAAAIDIANTSTYHPAHRGSHNQLSFYDFTLRFKGKSVSTNEVVSNSAAAQIDALIRHGKYDQAKAQVESALASSPSDPMLNEELGAADYFLADYVAAAAAFDKVPTISKTFAQVAAQSYALAAVKTTNTTDAVSYAKRAVALQPDANTYYALGTAELNAGDGAAAASDLKKALSRVQADPKSDTKTKVNIAAQLYQAYKKAGDSDDAQQTLALIKQWDPNNTSLGTMQGNELINAADAASKAGDHATALADFEKAAQVGSPQVQVTAYAAAALEQNQLLQSQKEAPVKSDYAKVVALANKALAINSNDVLANFAAGVGLTGEYVADGKQDAGLKTQALAALTKAKSQAQATSNPLLSNIEAFLKSQWQQ